MQEKKTLNQWRKERGLEVKQLAEKAGVDNQIVHWLYGGTVPAVTTGAALAEALGVSVSQIIWGKAERVEVPPMPRSPTRIPGQPQVSREQYELAQVWLSVGRSKKEIAAEMGVSRQTLYAAFARFEKE